MLVAFKKVEAGPSSDHVVLILPLGLGDFELDATHVHLASTRPKSPQPRTNLMSSHFRLETP